MKRWGAWLAIVVGFYLFFDSPLYHSFVSTTYHVNNVTGSDMNPGTAMDPFLTAHQCIVTMVAGDTCYVHASGTDYRNGVNGESIGVAYNAVSRGTSWSNKITLAPYPGDTINWTTPGFGDSTIIMQIGGGPDILDYYWEIGAFVFHADGAFNIGFPGVRTSGYALEGINAQYVRYNGSTMTYSIRSCIAPSVHNGQNYWEFISVQATYCGDGQIITPDHGLYWSSSHLLVDRSEFDHNSSYGIQIYKGGETDIDDIVIRNSKFDYNYWGDHMNSGGGGGTVQASGHGHILYNNLIYRNLSDGAIFNYGCVDCAAYNNTFYLNTDCGVSSGNGGASNTNINFTNNISYANGTNVCNPGAAMGTVITNNFTTDPSFVDSSANNFNLTSSSGARNYGLNLTSLAILGLDFDYAGYGRPAVAAWDAGAYQFQGCSSPSKLLFSAQPSDATLGGSLGTVSVGIYDSSNSLCNSSTNTITLSKNGSATWGTLASGSSLSKAASSGIATWTDLSVTTTGGSGSIDAGASGLTGATSNSITITAMSPSGIGSGRLKLR